MAVSNRLRFEIFRRDRFACRYCGRSATRDQGVVLEIDHVLPTVLGGGDEPTNLVTACDKCNSGKGSTHPDSPPIDAETDADALRWWKATKWAADKLAADLDAKEQAHAEFEKIWNRWTYTDGDEKRHIPRPDTWRDEIDRLLAAGLPMWALEDSIEEAMKKGSALHRLRFQWMRESAWLKVQELRDAATAILQGDATASSLADQLESRACNGLAERFLKRFAEEERAQAFADEDAINEDDGNLSYRAVGALWFAIRNTLLDRAALKDALDELLQALPDGSGVLALAEARADLRRHVGENANDHVAVANAAISVTWDLQVKAAAEYLSSLPTAERDEWMARARAFYADIAEHLEDDAYLIEAADQARLSKSEHKGPVGLCGSAGQHGASCPRMADYHVAFVDCPNCIERGLDVCCGRHGMCREHVAALREGIHPPSRINGQSLVLKSADELVVTG
jgi:hypothetical protein